MPYTGTPPGGADHGPSIKNPATYEALVREGMSKSRAAAISNAAPTKGRHRGSKSPSRGRRGPRRQRKAA